MALRRPITSTLLLWFIWEARWSHFWRLAWTFIRPLRRAVSECHLEIYQFALYQQSLFGLTMLVYLIKAKIKTAQFHVCDFCWLWIKKCLLKLLTSLNDLLHLAHLCGFSPLWIMMCFLRVPALLNNFLHWAHARLLSTVGQKVTPQIGKFAEWLCSLSTCVHLLSTANWEVIFEISSLTEYLFAFRTDVQFFSTVSRDVLAQSFSFTEWLFAFSTFVWLLSTVS